ncbi:GNAT family N-acetyltransferase [Chiayiivirga flava]|uniref:GNAT family N-acetyltransferase n=1 Tax=Chiayiivirga flava TaxID=659595 RepID=UPI00161EDE45
MPEPAAAALAALPYPGSTPPDRARRARPHHGILRSDVHPKPGTALKPQALTLRADWHYETSDHRRHYVIRALVDNRIAGRAHGWFEPGRQFVLEKIEMHRSQRSRGYGSALIEQLRHKAREKGCRELVFRSVRDSNTRAIKLYASLGARPVRTSEHMCAFVLTPP